MINAKRVQVDAAKRRWLFRHQDFFQPLLPSTNFFDVLRKEVSELGGEVTYVPFHVLTEQPTLIQGGEMKEYQVCLLWWHVGRLTCESCQAARIGVSCVHVQQWWVFLLREGIW